MLKDRLIGKLSKKEMKIIPSSFDIIGNRDKAVAIIEIPKKLKKKEKIIATALMKQHKNVKTVLEKKSPRKGIYRTRKLRIIKGIKNTEILHVENGYRLFLDPKKVYFSPREATERLRIAEKTKKNEIVMVFFAGVGPFAIVISRKSMPKKVIGIEINPYAVRYFWKNIKANKLDNVQIILGDVKKKSKKFYGKCDRILMPLPENSFDYIDEAKKCTKTGGIIHFYLFSSEKEILEWKKKLKKHSKILEIKKVLPYGPGIWKYRIDFIVNKN